MPPRPPPPPRILVVLCSVAAVAAAWLAVLIEQAARGALASTLGGYWPGLELTRYLTLMEARDGRLGLGAFPLLGVTLGGVAAPALAGMLLGGVASVFRTSGWFRALALQLLVLGLLWLPTALAAAALPNGGGPILELYERLGDPPAGRWAALGLAVVALWLLAGPAAGRAVATGRSWMRADGIEFRRRLVRVVAGYPALIAIGAVVVTGAWMSIPVAIGWLVAVFAALTLTTN